MRVTPSAPRRLAPVASVLLLALSAACASGGSGAGGQVLSAPRASFASAPKSDWIQLFNGRDLTGWDVKFKGHQMGDNFNDTFRVEDGLLRVRYDKYTGWNGEWGHIFAKPTFSYFLVAAEYRFVDNQVVGAPPGIAWAIRNNGIMIGQSAESMGLQQDYPISLEVQLLGGLGTGKRTTANLCTPGTNVHFGEKFITAHCTNSTSATYDGDQWVRVEALVLGDSMIKHIAGGDTVFTYRKPEMGGGAANNPKPGVMVNGTWFPRVSISLQAESSPTDFRKVEVLNLEGCMDPKSKSYKPYFIKHDPAACK
ncbi:MAG: DUF1080 domain-containing protein [bacterium]